MENTWLTSCSISAEDNHKKQLVSRAKLPQNQHRWILGPHEQPRRSHGQGQSVSHVALPCIHSAKMKHLSQTWHFMKKNVHVLGIIKSVIIKILHVLTVHSVSLFICTSEIILFYTYIVLHLKDVKYYVFNIFWCFPSNQLKSYLVQPTCNDTKTSNKIYIERLIALYRLHNNKALHLP